MSGAVTGAAAGAPPWKRPESVLVVVHAAADGAILLLQRADDPAFWQSVTGSLEADETPPEAARRELLEETGLDVPVSDHGIRSTFEIRPPWRARYAPGITHNVEHVFDARVERALDVTLAAGEHLAYRWLTPPEALARASSATNREAIRRLAAARA